MSSSVPLFSVSRFCGALLAVALTLPVVPQQVHAQDLIINELLADNERGLLDPNGEADDWIELVNVSGATLDLGTSVFYLTDDPLDPTQYQLPNRQLAAGERLLIWADNQTIQGDDHAPFRLGSGGEDLQLIASDGTTVLQTVTFGAQRADVSWSLVPDLMLPPSGAFQFSVTTPLQPNDDNAPPHISLVEQIPQTVTQNDELIVRATVNDDSDPSVMVDLMLTVDGGAPATHAMLDDGLNDDGLAGDGVYGVNLGLFGVGTQLEYWIEAEDSETATSREPANAPVDQIEVLVVSANCPVPELYINEFMADNDTIIADENGQFDDWFEIYNPGTETVNLLCLFVTDDLLDPLQYALPDVDVPAGGFVIVWADGDGSGLHANFSLRAGGEEIGIYTVDSAPVDELTYTQQTTDASQGRFPDGSDTFVLFGDAANANNPITPGSSNHQPIFSDGWEAGDNSAWSSFTP